MANKFYGPVGYEVVPEEPDNGICAPEVVERNYSGDVLKNYFKAKAGVGVIDNIDVDNRISILSDPFALNHFHEIKYVKWMGAAWKVSSVDVQYPRLILSIGGVYNGETATTE